MCRNQPVYLHCGLIGWFLHGAGFPLFEIFEQFLVFFISFLILLARCLTLFVIYKYLFVGLYHKHLLLYEFYMLFAQFPFKISF